MVGSGIKRGTAELAILSVLETGGLHGYEIARRIEKQTQQNPYMTLGWVLAPAVALLAGSWLAHLLPGGSAQSRGFGTGAA